eukprot:CAMPEP_0184968152 /NCGR_PEP_ID=MMETSP1098-20130426/1276_1 /TAXON_ID=89044 /ORGANISM="Spumella elongata, Strain CCAP 955/1" /LENGTH=830 /DNA_ID=CAMNT_0027489717 /DNA_START=375 /DNA_END=2867 /DNA_ORIENTATION=-
MNEMNGFVLKGRPLRIRWAAKRNQPVKSENTALHTAATMFVKFASQTGIIVSEALMRDHFSVYGEILDATIRTITIDEAYNRSKGYGFVNFINDETQDGLAAAYRAAEELQNATVNGVNYRCEVGHKHQPNGKPAAPSAGPMHSDNASVGAYSSSSISLAMSTNSAVRPVFLPAIHSPGKPAYYGHPHQQPQPQYQQVSSGASVMSNNSHSSSAPASPHPAVSTSFLPVNPGAHSQQQQQQYPQQFQQGQAGAMSSNMSVGSGSASGVYPPYNSTSPHSPHPMSTIVSTISYVPTSSVPAMPNMYAHQQPQQVQGQVPTGASQSHYTSAQQQQYMLQQQQQYMQQHQQQYFAHNAPGQYYAQQQGMYPPQQHQQQAPAPQQGYYGSAQDPQYYAEQQYYGQGGYYAPQGHGVSNSVPNGSHYTNERPHQGQHQGQSAYARRPTGHPQPLNQNYMPQQQQQFVQYQQQYSLPSQQQQQQSAPEVAQPSSGRRSQRNVSNQSNISEITSATLNDLQGDEEDGDDADQDLEEQDAGEEEEGDAEEDEQAAANAAAMISGLRMDSQDDASLLGKSPSERAAAIAAATQQLKATLQVQSGNATRGAPVAASQPINCKLSERRKRNVSAGTNTTEITAQVLFDLQQQEQLLTQEEDDASNPATPKSQSSNHGVKSPSPKKSSSRSPVRSPRVSHNKGQYSPPPSDVVPRTRETSAASIAPFTMSSDALDELQKQAELADAASKERRTRRSNSERSTHSDITAALAFMGLDPSSAEPALRALADEDDAASSAENSLSHPKKPVCICGASGRQNSGSPYASSCPYGTSACSCVYTAAF